MLDLEPGTFRPTEEVDGKAFGALRAQRVEQERDPTAVDLDIVLGAGSEEEIAVEGFADPDP